MARKSTAGLTMVLMMLAVPLLATESMDNALFKGTNPLGDAMGKPVFANRVFQHGYHCWDPSLIKKGDTYHLFYSRWNMVEGKVNDVTHWMTTSEIVHATSKNILGPYTNVENPALTAEVNHDWSLHNPKITPEYNPDGSIKRYILYFINVRKGAIAGTSWLYSDDLAPGSWYGHHEELVKEAKFNNPALLFYPDGSAYGLSKGKDPAYPGTQRHLLAYRAKDFSAYPGEPEKRWGAPLPNGRGTINQLPGDVDHEDACLWEMNGQYHTIMTDMSGRATGGKKKAVMHWFTDVKSGTDYRLYSDVPLGYVGDSVTFEEGNTERYYRMERPYVYVNSETGEVEAFLLACIPREGSQSVPTEGAGIIIWPVDDWSPEAE
ncbi:glycoside hydrolase family protein [Pontiella sulfatireligans]|nr:hypothetical protein [Pontiella sulfatireligans]